MTTTYFSANSVGPGVRATTVAGNNLYVAAGVLVGSTDNYAVGVAGVENGLDIYGSVQGELGALSLLSATDTTINIRAGGVVGSSNTDSFGIAVNNSSASIENSGLVHGDIAIDILLSTDCQIVNQGEIRGTSAAIDVDATAHGEITLVNAGTISAALTSSSTYHSAGDVEDVILNKGRINGVISLGPGDDRYMGSNARPMDASYFAYQTGVSIAALVTAGDGRDLLYGSRYIDYFLGDEGGDMLLGQGGNDQLIGGGGGDRMSGGSGADDFIFVAPGDSRPGNRDRIGDFRHSQDDTIDLGAIDANVLRVGDQEFDFIGRDGFRHAGEVRFEYDKGDTIVQASVDGDRKAELVIELDGHIALVAGDFDL